MQNLEKILNEYKNSNLNADDVKNAVSEIFAKLLGRGYERGEISGVF